MAKNSKIVSSILYLLNMREFIAITGMNTVLFIRGFIMRKSFDLDIFWTPHTIFQYYYQFAM